MQSILSEHLPRVFSEKLGIELLPIPADGDTADALHLGFDACYELDLDDQRRLVCVQVKTGERPPDTEQRNQRVRKIQLSNPRAIVLFVAAALSESQRRELRKTCVNYADLEGHIYIWEPGIRIWLEQAAVRKPTKPVRRGGRRPNPFSRRASVVLRALLEAPDRRWGVRELSSETGLSVGYTSDVISELVARKYAASGGEGVSVEDPIRALFDWTRAYRWDQNGIHSFTVAYELDELQSVLDRELARGGIEYALTLLSGVDRVSRHVQHGQTHLYVRPDKLEAALEIVGAKLYGEPAASGGNLHVLDPYYARSAFYGGRRIDNVPVASNVQLFLDLVHYPVRGIEAAAMLLRTSLGRQLHLSREQIRTLITLLGGD
jgi:hypothetical protein